MKGVDHGSWSALQASSLAGCSAASPGVLFMPNGKPGDHPLTDLFHHGAHPFPADIEEMIWRLARIDPLLLDQIEPDVFDWEAGRELEAGRAKLKDLLARAQPNPIFGGKWPV
jgi:hypothetical protein